MLPVIPLAGIVRLPITTSNMKSVQTQVEPGEISESSSAEDEVQPANDPAAPESSDDDTTEETEYV